MRYLAVLGVLWLLAFPSVAKAQIQVSAQTQRTNFLLYERVDLLVTITNIGDTDLVLNNEDGHPWLSFLVSHHSQHNYIPVRQERACNFQSVELKAGENKTLRINLTPYYAFREEGNYRAVAVVDLPGQGQVLSENVPFTVLNGHAVWSQMRPVDGSQRVYSLIRFSSGPNDMALYLRVEDPADNIVYANLALGDLVSSIDPDVFFDPQGNIHVLQPVAMDTYLYTRADANGKVVHQGVFKTFQEAAPRLNKLADGNVTVLGGMEENPNAPRERLSEGQIAKKGGATPGTLQ